MPIRAFLLCSDEKALDAVSQVFAELDLSFEHFQDPAFAVRRLAVQRFDAILVDCDDLENATMVFDTLGKPGLNSSSISIAIADGKAGVPAAFRLGASLVMTKPVSLEQVRSTLRNAMSMHRKDSPEAKAVLASAGEGITLGPTELHSGERAGDGPAKIVLRTPAATVSIEPQVSSINGIAAPMNGLLGNSAYDAPAATALQGTTPSFPASLPDGTSQSNSFAEFRHSTSISGVSRLTSTSQGNLSESDDPDALAAGSVPARLKPAAPAIAPMAASRRKMSPRALGVCAVLVVAAAGYAAWTTQPAFRSVTLAQYEQLHLLIAGTASHSPIAATHTATAATASELPAVSVATTTAKEADAVNHTVADGFAAPASAPEQDSGEAQATGTAKATSHSVLLATSGAAKNVASNIVNINNVDLNNNDNRPVIVPEDVADEHVSHRVPASYPESARGKGLQGAVVLSASVNPDGTVDSLQVISGNAQLAPAAVEAVQQWRYDPYLHHGQPVAFQTQVTVRFQIRDKKTH